MQLQVCYSPTPTQLICLASQYALHPFLSHPTAEGSLEPLLASVRASPSDPEPRFALAEALEASGQHSPAVEACLEIIAAHGPAWGDGKARKLCLRIFEALGSTHPVVSAGRKRLSKLLFR